MKRLICLIFCLILTCSAAFAANPTPDFEIMSECAVVMESETGQVLYGRGMHDKKYPASITKVMTALVALEKGNLTDVYTVSDYAVTSVQGTSHIALAPGEVLTLEEALYGMMLASANDCSVVIAENVAGSEEAFVKLMNEKAQQIGAVNTSFVNPHGLHDVNHFTTAYDMALITREAMKNPDFVRIAGSKLYTMSPTNKQGEERLHSNQNLMLHQGKYYYEYARFGKNGFTTPAQNTMVVEAKRGSLELVCAVMHCADGHQKYEDAAKLLDFCYDNFYKTKIDDGQLNPPTAKLAGTLGTVGQVEFTMEGDVAVMLPNGVGTDSLEYSYDVQKSYKRASEYHAYVTVSSEGEELFKIPLTGTGRETITFYNVVKTILWIILAAVLFLASVVIYFILDAEHKKKQRRKARVRRTLGIKKDL